MQLLNLFKSHPSEDRQPLLSSVNFNNECDPISRDLIPLFLQGLNPSDLHACRLVAKAWKQAVDENTTLWPEKLERVLNIRQFHRGVMLKNLFLDIYGNLKYEKYRKVGNDPYADYYKKHFFGRTPDLDSFPQTKLFRVQGSSICYALENGLAVLKKFGNEPTIILPHEGGPIEHLEIQGNFIITSGLGAKHGKTQKNEVKIWDINDLSLKYSFHPKERVTAVKQLDQDHLVCGELLGDCHIWKLQDDGTAVAVAKLPQPKSSKQQKKASLISLSAPITFLHYVPSRDGGMIVARDTSQAMYFWMRDKNGAWKPEAVQSNHVQTDRVFHGVADLLFEAYVSTGEIRFNGAHRGNLSKNDQAIAKKAIQWMQFDEGRLYIASSEEKMYCLDFNRKEKHPKLKKKKDPIKKLKKDLRYTPKKIKARSELGGVNF